MRKHARITSFNLPPGRLIAGKYEILGLLGQGWEGEVYKIKERRSGIERAAKLFYPTRNIKDHAVRFYANKLHKLRNCSMVIQYHNEEHIKIKNHSITVMISEFVDGRLLSDFVNQHRGRRLTPYMALHVLYSLAIGLEEIHQLGDYHGDLHTDNIIVQRQGVDFELRLLDMFNWGAPKSINMLDDTVDLISVFYEIMGGQKYYANHPAWVKEICCGRKRSIIKTKFRTASELRAFLESITIM